MYEVAGQERGEQFASDSPWPGRRRVGERLLFVVPRGQELGQVHADHPLVPPIEGVTTATPSGIQGVTTVPPTVPLEGATATPSDMEEGAVAPYERALAEAEGAGVEPATVLPATR